MKNKVTSSDIKNVCNQLLSKETNHNDHSIPEEQKMVVMDELPLLTRYVHHQSKTTIDLYKSIELTGPFWGAENDAIDALTNHKQYVGTYMSPNIYAVLQPGEIQIDFGNKEKFRGIPTHSRGEGIGLLLKTENCLLVRALDTPRGPDAPADSLTLATQKELRIVLKGLKSLL